MLNTNATNFRKNIFSLLEQTIKYSEPINISTKDGNAVVISEADYNGLMETLYICSIPGMREELIAAKTAPASEFIPAEQVEW